MLITTTKGDLDEALLEKRTGSDEDENASLTWVEYWLDGEQVHRSVHVIFKRTPSMSGEAAEIT